MSVGYVSQGKQHVDKGIEHDNKLEYAEALQCYLQAIECFNTARGREPDRAEKQKIYAYASSIADRAEEVKKYLDGAAAGNKPKPPAAGAKGSPAAGGRGGAAAAGGKGGGKGGAKGAKGAADAPNRKRKRTEEEEELEKMKADLEGAVVVMKPNVRWGDVAGLEQAKGALQEAVILPVKYPQLFTGERKPWQGILMYGPPGTGKSYLAKAVATEAECTFFSISSADVMSKWVGDSEKIVRNLFRLARERRPAVIFIDEVDSVCSSRDSGDSDAGRRVMTELLVQMEGVGRDNSGVLVLGATNLPHKLDSAVRRRFERRIEISLPDVQTRAAILKLHVGATPHTLTDADFDQLAQRAEGYSGSDLSTLVRSALFEPVRTLQTACHFKEVQGPHPDPTKPGKTVKRLVPCAPGDPDPTKREATLLQLGTPELVLPPAVSADDFEKAFRSARPSVSQGDLAQIRAFTRDFGQEG
eukprot:TRINITY_DN3626_c0_g1_i2.p1 TRINITY_DN3626_c0_g1~~TRINITY_DN3626_c0_g1_i2.p1  ORF type:complete len:506 (+),score=212.95 TRINITY_DN3626_c0_g1_i2:104-1519(+)